MSLTESAMGKAVVLAWLQMVAIGIHHSQIYTHLVKKKIFACQVSFAIFSRKKRQVISTGSHLAHCAPWFCSLPCDLVTGCDKNMICVDQRLIPPKPYQMNKQAWLKAIHWRFVRQTNKVVLPLRYTRLNRLRELIHVGPLQLVNQCLSSKEKKLTASQMLWQ